MGYKINKVKFGALTEDQQTAKLTMPVYVPLTQNADDETFEQQLLRYGKFEKLPEIIRYKLTDFGTSQKIQLIGQKYNFELLRLANITRLIREYYFGEMPLEDFPREIEKRMGVSLLTAQEIARYVKSEIIDWDPWAEYVAKLSKVPIREALAKFPEVGEQLITENKIEIKNFPEPVRPSIRNWLHDYTQHLGQDKHPSMQRTDYIFHSENTQSLASPEREKLAIILKSFDDNDPLLIDGESQEVVFESPAKKEAPPQSSFAVPPQPAASVNFIRRAQRPAVPSAPVQDQKNSFVRYYPKPEIPKAQTLEDSSKPSLQMKFTNPYPKPGTHEVPFEKTSENIANVRFSEGAPKASFTPISQVSAKKIPAAGSSSSPAVPTRPPAPVQKSAPLPSTPVKPTYRFIPPDKNIIRPHLGGMTGEGTPEPRIQGNTVDLREQ